MRCCCRLNSNCMAIAGVLLNYLFYNMDIVTFYAIFIKAFPVFIPPFAINKANQV